MTGKSFKISRQTKENISNYNRTICFNDSLKQKFKELLSVFDTDGSGKLEDKNKNGKNEIEIYFNAIMQAAALSGNKLELDSNEAQNLINNVIKNPKIKADDLVEFSKIVANTIDISTITSNIQNFKNRNGVTTTNISVLSNIVKNQITQDNVLDVLEKYKKTTGQSFFDLIADYKLVDDNTRKELVLDVYNKLIQHVKTKGKDVELLQQLGTEEIRYQFRKVGSIDKDNVNAFFDALAIIAHRKTTHLKAGKSDKYIDEFKIPKYEKKKENIGKFKNIIFNKSIKYSLKDGTTIEEFYYYDKNKKTFVLESRYWSNKAGENLKIATYYNGNENSIATVHFFKNNKQIETHSYSMNGMEHNATYSSDKDFRVIMFGENGIATEDTQINNTNDANRRKETTSNYNFQGEESRGSSAKIDVITLCAEEEKQLAQFYSLLPEESDFGGLPNFTMPGHISDFDIRTQRNIMMILFHNCEMYPTAEKVEIEDLKNKCLEYIENEDPTRAWACYDQAISRASALHNRRFKYNPDRKITINGKIDIDFRQGNFGSCWLTAAIKSLTLSPNGQKLLSEIVKQDPATGNITITLKGAPEGQQVYTYTKKQIEEANELSVGDGDARAIEMAFRDFFMEDNSDIGFDACHSISGNDLQTAFSILTGRNIIDYVDDEEARDSFENKKNSQKLQLYFHKKLDTLIGKKNLVAMCCFVTDFDAYYPINNNGTTTSTEIYTCHAYSFKAVDKNYVYVINPHDTSQTIKIARKDFEKYCGEITILNI